ncbi:FAD-binding oxidoreductase [Phyllobacterium bourgognense]|uniref:FAD/FMN-containing dehydrogenase n=1 Tax=Phyllobacterium bourgognense TaxID=314236 RepID=A0A368Z4M5_9HYPH|nr:FAD-binding oxidoreductase [Phyllobacterium bourgognense]RCW86187.1 FAD/FMN-containing dehydrogenase [Phyllobacterium bourgognense]
MMAGYDSFGLIDRHPRTAISLDAARQIFESGNPERDGFLPFGNGKSYGDSCHNDRGTLIDMRGNDALISFDPQTGLLAAEAGLMLSDIIALAAPHGYFLPVTPGTRFVTLGGAIANDVHGKNHHRRGTFGCHVERFDLLKSDGTVVTCSASMNSKLFAATIGGLGLTGIILSASIRLLKVNSLDVVERVRPFASLAEYFEMAPQADNDNEYAVAWVDQLSSGRRAGRGVLLTGNHADNGSFEASTEESRLGVPFELPISALNYPSLKLFNAAYFHFKGRKREPHLSTYQTFFYPLDSVSNWNRLYGRTGLYQHQSVIPEDAASAVVPQMLAATREAGQSSFLTVLKRFGNVASPGIMSFPRAGYTLTVDFPNRGARTLALLERLDSMTIDADGRVNPYKDQRMSSAVFKAGFPGWQELEKERDPAFNSNFWVRTALAGRTA